LPYEKPLGEGFMQDFGEKGLAVIVGFENHGGDSERQKSIVQQR